MKLRHIFYAHEIMFSMEYGMNSIPDVFMGYIKEYIVPVDKNALKKNFNFDYYYYYYYLPSYVFYVVLFAFKVLFKIIL